MRTEVEREVLGDGGRGMPCGGGRNNREEPGTSHHQKTKVSHSHLGDGIKKVDEEQAPAARQ